MATPRPRLSPDDVRAQLQRLRQGPALGHPGAVKALSPELRTCLLTRQRPLSPSAGEVSRLVAALRQAIDGLSPLERRYAATDFNVLPEHSWPTLSERQESLARVLGCTAKTVRRHAGQALDTLAQLITDGSYLPPPPAPAVQENSEPPAGPARFLGITHASRVDVVCSQLPDHTTTPTRPSDPLYARYSRFADLDSLFYVRIQLARAFPTAHIRDFHPGEYYDADADTLIVIGAPHRNAKYAEFLPHLPCRFSSPPDAGLAFPDHTDTALSPRWTPEGELLADLSVITRLTLAQGTRVILLGGCLTLGVLGAAKCLFNGDHGIRNTGYLNDLAGERDLIVVTETGRIGGITDTPDFTTTEPLLALTRDGAGSFTTAIDTLTRQSGPGRS
ncbi:hypothetical protein ACODT3_41555 [Streptomyces sp. 4.24]|uniref:hypothetical protein n=1 Tax=Streptomyces tritrimontium TaxID=3406573 RepID=UPI003BB4A8F8